MLTPVVGFQHEDTLVRQLQTPCVPLLGLGMFGAVVEELGSDKGSEADVVNTKVNFGSHLVAIGCRVVSVDPTQ